MKIGNMVIPNFRLAFLLSALKKIDDTFKGEEGSKRDIAEILGHATYSGTLAQKIGDLKTYGLLEGRKDKLRVTDLGRQAVSADEKQQNEAIEQAVKHVPLWGTFYKKYGPSIGPEQFAVYLRRETHSEESIDEKNIKFARNAYLKDVKLIESVSEPRMEPEHKEPLARRHADRKSVMEEQAAGTRKVSMELGEDYGMARIEVRNQSDFDIAQNVLETIRLSLNLRKSSMQLLLEAIASKLDIPPLTTTDRSSNDQTDNEEPKENLDSSLTN